MLTCRSWHIEIAYVFLHCGCTSWQLSFSLCAGMHWSTVSRSCMPRCTGAISCRDYRALEESAQVCLANMKALRSRGESGLPGLRRCATQMLITKQYLAMGQKKGGGWEGLLREALVVSALALHVAQVWRDKAAVYRQHAMALLERMGQPVPRDCLLCSTALHADKPTNIRKLSAKGGAYLNNCGHVLHIMCQGKSEASGALGNSCSICARQGPKRPSGGSWW